VSMRVSHRPPLPLIVVAGVLLAYLIAPILLIVPMSLSSSQYLRFPPPGWSLQWYQQFFGTPAWLEALANSALIGLISGGVATVIGSAAAYGLVRGDFFGRQVVFMFLISPLVVPPIVLAISLYGVYAYLGVVGGGLGIVIGHIVIATPLVVVTVMASLQRFDPVYERASYSLGAGRLRTVLTVTIPNIWPGILSGFLLAFVSSFDELVIAMFVGGSVMTLPRKMWEDLVVIAEPTQAAASIVLILVSTAALGLWSVAQYASSRSATEV
jgi:ABC-type spermidine/putrescine transport system permease subunit II